MDNIIYDNRYQIMLEDFRESNITFISESEYMDTLTSAGVFTEAYFGKTKGVLKIENVVARLCAQISIDPYITHNNTPVVKELEATIQNVFGFKKVIINITSSGYDMPLIYTYPDLDRFSSSYDIVVNKKTGYYDKNHNHVCIIQLSSTFPIQYGFTPAEYTAFILHEIGHNFDKSPYLFLKLMICILTHPINAVLINTPFNTLRMKLSQGVSDTISKNPILKKINEWFIKASDYLANKITLPLLTLSIPTLPAMIVPGIVTMLKNAPGRKNEEFADSFTVSYGYGKELASGLTKVHNRFSPKYNNKSGANKSFATVINDLGLATYELIITLSGDEHGTTASRMLSMLDNAESDLNDSNFSPEMKETLLSDINNLRNRYNTFLGLNKSNPDICRKYTYMVRQFIDRVFKGYPNIFAKRLPNIKVVSTNESVLDTKLYIYESFYNNEISSDMKDKLLSIINEYVTNMYYRYTYNGTGIYQALKDNIDRNTWNSLLKTEVFNWLPKPDVYLDGYSSYFTPEGNSMFKNTVLPLCYKYLNPSKIKIETISDINNIVYRDKYQVIADNVVSENTKEI